LACLVNLGTGQVYSVLQMVKAFDQASGKPIPYRICPRRAGDIAQFGADAMLAKQTLDWQPTRTLDQMRADAWRWQQVLNTPTA